MPSRPDHRQILKTRVAATSYHDACDRIQRWASTQTSSYIVPVNVDVVMTANIDNWSLNLDLEIPLETVQVVILGKGAD